MAKTLYLPDGEMVVLLSDDDFLNLVWERLGNDAENEVKEYIQLADYEEQAVKTDLSIYEMDLDSNRACFNEILEIIEQIRNTARLDKPKLHKLLCEIEKIISNQI